MTLEFIEKEFAETLNIIGSEDSVDKQAFPMVIGKWDFSADILPGKKLFSRILMCPHTHANIVSIDTSKAEALEGVEAVITYKDLPGISRVVVRTSFCVETAHYWGECVAAVAAVDEDTAEEAVQLIDVDYEVLPFVIDPDEAMQPGAPLAAPDRWPDTNINPMSDNTRGDIEQGFAEADVIVEATIGWLDTWQHNTIEPMAAVAWWVGDELYAQSSSQTLFSSHQQLATAFKLPLHNVHHISHGTGGAFGSKASNGNVPIMAALLSQKAGGRPVQMHHNRMEHLANSVGDYAAKATIRFGAKNDGTLTAIEAQYYTDDGCAEAGVTVGTTALVTNYVCPNLLIKRYRIITNKRLAYHFRSPGSHKGVVLCECAIDVLCEKLGVNPLQWRLQNMVPKGMLDQDTGTANSHHGLRDCLEWAANAIDFNQKWHAPGTSTLADGRKHGVGLSMMLRGLGGTSAVVGSIINMTHDGKAILNSGITRASGGTSTGMCHIVAEALGMSSVDDVNMVQGDTDWCSDGGFQAGSTRTPTLGPSFLVAALDCRKQLLEAAAIMLEVSAAELDASDGKIFVKADPSQFQTIASVCASVSWTIIGSGYGWSRQLRKEADGQPVGSSCNMGGQPVGACEVAVDTETGEVEVLKYAFGIDIGRAVFRKGAMGQAESSMDMVIGQTLHWGDILDPTTGALLNNAFVESRYPTAPDMPVENNKVKLFESIDACGAFGSTGMGEPPAEVNGCLNNAIANAIGVRIDEQPVTPQKILKALGKA